jgi:GGDEF domain-containing protein
MGFSSRIFLLDGSDALYRLANTAFAAMLQDPDEHPYPLFAGQRIRMADATVELMDRRPIAVARVTFGILAFDEKGRLNSEAFQQQQFARAETALAGVIEAENRDSPIVEARARFLAQGGQWTPSKLIERALDDAAMGRIKCPRL